MKTNISRQTLYLLGLTLFLLLFIFIFSFGVLIPKGKEYRVQNTEQKIEREHLNKYQLFNDKKLNTMKSLKEGNKAIISAFDKEFNPLKFKKEYKKYFSKLELSQEITVTTQDEFELYEVNTTSEINSPKSFYSFLESINKSIWIIKIDFPIHFKRSNKNITSAFTMKVYKIEKQLKSSDGNSTKVKHKLFED